MYNPYDVLLLLRRRRFAAHWFETGTPAFLVETLFERGYADKYRGRGEPIHLIGVEFSRETRNVTAFEAIDA